MPLDHEVVVVGTPARKSFVHPTDRRRSGFLLRAGPVDGREAGRFWTRGSNISGHSRLHILPCEVAPPRAEERPPRHMTDQLLLDARTTLGAIAASGVTCRASDGWASSRRRRRRASPTAQMTACTCRSWDLSPGTGTTSCPSRNLWACRRLGGFRDSGVFAVTRQLQTYESRLRLAIRENTESERIQGNYGGARQSCRRLLPPGTALPGSLSPTDLEGRCLDALRSGPTRPGCAGPASSSGGPGGSRPFSC